MIGWMDGWMDDGFVCWLAERDEGMELPYREWNSLLCLDGCSELNQIPASKEQQLKKRREEKREKREETRREIH